MSAPVEANESPGPRGEGPGGRARWIAAIAWLALAAAGFLVLARYASTPGGSDPAVARRWPDASRLDPPASRPVLVLFLHPECPCSRATVEGLARVIARAPDAYDASALFVPPATAAGTSGLREAAARIPGLRLLEDPGGAEAAHFGARTSGTVAVYGVDGGRLFFGGITAARAHEGDSDGSGALLALARGATPARTETPVYGCGLAGPVQAAVPTPAGRDRDGP